MEQIAKALVKFQGGLTNPKAESTNPFFKSKYADLFTIWETIRKPLKDNGLSISQRYSTKEGGTGLKTTLFHESGESIDSWVPFMPAKDIQQFGAQTTYLRRFSLCAILGIVADTDDDGESAVNRTTNDELDPGEYVIKVGKYKGQAVKDIGENTAKGFISWVDEKKAKGMAKEAADMMARYYLDS